MVNHPGDYKWSSYQHYAYGKNDPLLDEPECYINLGNTPEKRQKLYRQMVETILAHDWKEKKDYSVSAHIGNPEWVSKRYEAVLAISRNRTKSKPIQKFPPARSQLV